MNFSEALATLKRGTAVTHPSLPAGNYLAVSGHENIAQFNKLGEPVELEWKPSTADLFAEGYQTEQLARETQPDPEPKQPEEGSKPQPEDGVKPGQPHEPEASGETEQAGS